MVGPCWLSILKIAVCTGSSLLQGLFSSCDEEGLSQDAALRLLVAVASLAVEQELWVHRLP